MQTRTLPTTKVQKKIQEETTLTFLANSALSELLFSLDGMTDDDLKKVIKACEVVLSERTVHIGLDSE